MLPPIRNRRATPTPVDAWIEDESQFLVFELLPQDGVLANGHEPPVAVFAVRPPEQELVSAVIVTAGAEGEEPHITNLRQPTDGDTALYATEQG
jgi:hypothetical protein